MARKPLPPKGPTEQSIEAAMKNIAPAFAALRAAVPGIRQPRRDRQLYEAETSLLADRNGLVRLGRRCVGAVGPRGSRALRDDRAGSRGRALGYRQSLGRCLESEMPELPRNLSRAAGGRGVSYYSRFVLIHL